MATYQKGILGDFSGKVGTVIGSHWRGKAVLRSLPNKSKKPPSAAQQLQRDKFKSIHNFLRPVKPILSETFGIPLGSKSRYNQAISYHLKEAITFQNSDFHILYSKVLISMGPLGNLENLTVTSGQSGSLHLQWTNNSLQGVCYPDDVVLVVAYAPNIQEFLCFTHAALREAGNVLLTFNPVFHGLDVELWVGVTNYKTQRSATSRYLGSYLV